MYSPETRNGESSAYLCKIFRGRKKTWQKTQNVSIVGEKTGNLHSTRAQDSDPSYGTNKRNDMAKNSLIGYEKTLKQSKA